MRLFLFSVCATLLFTACKKDDNTIVTPATTCDVRGEYVGTGLASTGASTTLAYSLLDNNFAVGSITLGGTPTTFGGYSNTCDSIYISAHFDINDSYYLLKGMLSNNDSVVTGTFQNLTTTSDFGTFTMRKQ